MICLGYLPLFPAIQIPLGSLLFQDKHILGVPRHFSVDFGQFGISVSLYQTMSLSSNHRNSISELQRLSQDCRKVFLVFFFHLSK